MIKHSSLNENYREPIYTSVHWDWVLLAEMKLASARIQQFYGCPINLHFPSLFPQQPIELLERQLRNNSQEVRKDLIASRVGCFSENALVNMQSISVEGKWNRAVLEEPLPIITSWSEKLKLSLPSYLKHLGLNCEWILGGNITALSYNQYI